MPFQTDRQPRTLQAAVTKAANFSGSGVTIPGKVRSLIVTLDITAATHTDETYDFYITSSDGLSIWDIIHFPQIATTGAKRFTAFVQCLLLLPQNVTTAAPGVSAVTSSTLATITGAANAIKSLGAGIVRHAPIGLTLAHELVVAGSAPSISYSLTATACL